MAGLSVSNFVHISVSIPPPPVPTFVLNDPVAPGAQSVLVLGTDEGGDVIVTDEGGQPIAIEP